LCATEPVPMERAAGASDEDMIDTMPYTTQAKSTRDDFTRA
jgi:hypothetical protein